MFAVIRVVYRRAWPAALASDADEPATAVHYPLMTKTVLAVGVMLVAFLAGVPIALVAVAGAAYCCSRAA